MRYSVIGLLGTALVGMMVGCGEDATDAPSGDTGAAAGKAGNASGGSKASGGKGGAAAGKGGGTAGSTNDTGGSTNGSGGSTNGGSNNGSGGSATTGGSSTTGGTDDGTGGSSAGTSANHGGTGGTVVIPSTGGSSGEAGTGDAEAGASGAENGGMAGAIEGSAGMGTGGTAGMSAGGIGGTAGTDAAGTAGSSAAGTAGTAGTGSSSCAGVQCDSTCVDPSARTLDVYLPSEPDWYDGVDGSWSEGEHFTVATSGFLTGIEVSVATCDHLPTSNLELELFDDQGTSLGHVDFDSAALAAIPTDCGVPNLAADSIGNGYFDLTPLCISATSGQELTALFSAVGGTPETCDGSVCSSSGYYCEEDRDCNGSYRLGASSAAYAGGNAVGRPSGGSIVTDSYHLAFKTFMQ